MRGNWIRLVVGAVAVTLGGCTCDQPQPTCADSTITFETPMSGALVDSPFQVSANVKNADGSAFNIDAATLSVGGRSFTGTVSGNRATFTGVTAAPGAQTLSVAIAKDTCSKTATSTITVRDACATPAVTFVSFAGQDTQAPLGILSAAELPPGTNLQVRVDATCVSDVQVQIKRGTTVVGGPVAFVNGTVTVTLPTLPDSDSARYDLFAELVRGGTALNTPMSNPAASGSIQVSRAPPMVALTVGSSFGPADDADTAMSGFQVRVTGTAPVNTSCVISVPGAMPPTQSATPNMMGDVSADFTVASGNYTATLSCTDAALNTGTTTAMFTVDFTPPSVVITSPANLDGGATMVVTQSPLTVTVSAMGAEDGSVAVITRNGMGVDSEMVMNGMVTFQVPFSTDGTYTLEVEVTDLAGNTGRATITVVVQLSGCGAGFSRPMACPALLTAAQLPSGTYTFQTASNPICNGQPATLFRSDVLADGGVTTPVALGMTTLSGTGIASYPPATLTSGEYIIRADVTNPGPDAGISSVTCDVTVDLDGPAITSPVVPSGQTVATLNATQDSQPGTPGVQRTLSFSARVPQGGRVDVCTTQAVDPVTTQQRQTSTECGSGWYVLQVNVTSPVSGFTFPEGTYQVKVVVVGGGLSMAPASPPVDVLSDATRPCVVASSRRLPQDTNADGRLNIAELNGMQPTIEFQLDPACGGTSLAPTGGVVLRDIVSNAVGSVRPATFAVNAATVTATLTGSYTSELDLTLFIDLTDPAGNKNLFTSSTGPGTFAFRVDPVAPTCNIQTPGAGQTLFGVAAVPGGAFDVSVATSADVGTGGVSVTFTGQTARTLTPSLSTATTTYALTGDSTYTIGATCTDSAGNSGTATNRTPRVDLVAPTCYFVTPTNNATLGVNDVPVTVTIGSTTAGDPTTAVILSTATGISNNVLTISGSSASGTVSLPNGTQDLLVNYADQANNVCIASSGNLREIRVTVNGMCGVAFAPAGPVRNNPNGNWLNRSGAGVTGTTNPASVSAQIGLTSDCGSGKNVYLNQMALGGTPTGTPVATAADGSAVLPSTVFAEGQQWTVSIEVSPGVYRQQTFFVSLRLPAIASIGFQRSSTVTSVIAVPPNTPLVFGAASGNRRVETATATDYVFANLNGSATDGAEFRLTLGAVTDAVFGTQNGSLEFLGVTPSVSPIAVNSASFVPTVPVMKLPHQLTDGTVDFVVRVTSPSGNVLESRHTSEVDVIPPSAPGVTQTLASARAATVNLAWSPVFDDLSSSTTGGLTGGPVSFPAGYDVRWTTSSVAANNSMAAATDYFGSASRQDGITAWSANPINKALTLPPINTYFIGVRARDEVGNYSAFAAPTALANSWTTTVLTAPVASTSFGASVVGAPLVGNDSANDLVVSATGVMGGGAVYVYDSASLGSSQAGCSTGCQALVPSDTMAGTFGGDVSIGNVGAVGAESKPDLVIAQLSTAAAPNNGGRVVLFFGTTAATLSAADSIEFRGDSTTRIGQTATVLRDINGDGRDEIAIAAPLVSSNRGRVFIYLGRDRAAWVALRTATDPTSLVPFIPVGIANADHVIDGPFPLLSTGNSFGQNRRGLISVSDLDGDTFPDVAIPTSRGTINRYRVYGSLAVKASSGAMPLDGTSGYRLEMTEVATADASIVSGVGTAALSGDFTGSSASDLVVSWPGAGGGGQVMIVSGVVAPSTPTVNPTLAYRIVGPLTFGQAVSMGAIDSDSSPDLVSATNLTTGNSAHILYQRTGTFETTTSGFWQTRFDAAGVSGNTNSRLGISSWIGDISSDSAADLVLGDTVAGEIRIWR